MSSYSRRLLPDSTPYDRRAEQRLARQERERAGNAERQRRWRARQRGEDVPYRRPGRPRINESPEQLLAEVYRWIDRRLPDEDALIARSAYMPLADKWWNIAVAIEELQKAATARHCA